MQQSRMRSESFSQIVSCLTYQNRIGRVILSSTGGGADSSPNASEVVFSNRVQCLRKTSFTTPVGPLRCLARISSAWPRRSCARVVHFGPENESDEVCILLDSARIAEIAQLRAMIALLPRLDGAAQLREHHDGNVEFL